MQVTVKNTFGETSQLVGQRLKKINFYLFIYFVFGEIVREFGQDSQGLMDSNYWSWISCAHLFFHPPETTLDPHEDHSIGAKVMTTESENSLKREPYSPNTTGFDEQSLSTGEDGKRRIRDSISKHETGGMIS